MKYVKCLGIIFIPILVLGMIYTSLYYFDVMGSNIFKWISLITMILSILIGCMYLGKNSKSKGWFEGLKIGLGVSLLFFMISFLGFESFSLKNIIYYLVIILTSMLGSMFGIRNVKVDN